MNVARRANLILQKMDSYHPASSMPADWISPDQLDEGELLIGVYVNPVPEPDVLITSIGLHIGRNQEWKAIPFRSIRSVKTPKTKDNVRGIECFLQDNRSDWIPITGSRAEKFYDAFEFLRFLDRVLSDLDKDRQEGHT